MWIFQHFTCTVHQTEASAFGHILPPEIKLLFSLLLIWKLGLQVPVGYINIPSKTCQFCKRAFSSLYQIHLGNIDKVWSQQGVIVPKTRWLLGKCEERTLTSTDFSQSWLIGGEESSASKSIHPYSCMCSEGRGTPMARKCNSDAHQACSAYRQLDTCSLLFLTSVSPLSFPLRWSKPS